MQPRRALVTGGASGIGYAAAEALLASGASVAIGDINTDTLEEAAKALNSSKVLPVHLDVASRQSVEAAVSLCAEKFNGLDTLINCAGIFDVVSLDDMTEAQWDRIIDIDLKGVFLCCQAAAPYLRRSGRGRIVTISSDAGKKGYSLISGYCAAKFGVIGFSRAIAGELAPHGVTVNCVCPVGVSTTRMGKEILEWLSKRTGESTEKILAARADSIPVKRMATTNDVVHAIMFFVSDEASFFTGEAINVDGGVLNVGIIPGIAEPGDETSK
jgi:NAD(P)-dependent dehydrogenase (short-subunit alcohol dehydrogenase family)